MAKKKILFLFRGDRTELLNQVRQGLAPDEFLYGFPYVQGPELDVSYIEDPRPFATWKEKIYKPFERWFGYRYTVGFNFHFYATNRERIRQADVVISTVDSYGLPLLWRKRNQSLLPKVIHMSHGLHAFADAAEGNRLNEWVRKQVGACLQTADRVLLFGHGDEAAMHRQYDDCARLNTTVDLFGIDEKFWVPGDKPAAGDYVLSVGSDILRDYPLLLKAIGPHPLKIVTQHQIDPSLLTPQTTILSKMSWKELRTLYQNSLFVVNPIRNKPRNSGHSATLQAMACGKAVILSHTPGLRDPKLMIHNETCYLVQPENLNAMREAIQFLIDHPAEAARIGAKARRLVETEYTSARFGERLQTCIGSLV